MSISERSEWRSPKKVVFLIVLVDIMSSHGFAMASAEVKSDT